MPIHEPDAELKKARLNSPRTVSVVIPAFNRAIALRNTLLTLRHQSLSPNRFEVILVDDGSKEDIAPMSRSLGLENLSVISVDNRGPGPARNIGARTACGDLLVFLDSDILTRRDFLEAHLACHAQHAPTFVSGMGHWFYAATCDYDDGWVFRGALRSFFSQEWVKVRLAGQSSRPCSIMTDDDIAEQSFEKFICPLEWVERWGYNSIVATYGESLHDFAMPWLSCCAGNLSIARDALAQVGGFDETLRCYEDWELGYRIFKEGGTFRFSLQAEAVQQLVPTSKRNEEESYQILLQKHPDLAVGLLSLLNINGNTFCRLSDVLNDHRSVVGRELRSRMERMVRRYALGERPPFSDEANTADGDSSPDGFASGAWSSLYKYLAGGWP